MACPFGIWRLLILPAYQPGQAPLSWLIYRISRTLLQLATLGIDSNFPNTNNTVVVLQGIALFLQGVGIIKPLWQRDRKRVQIMRGKGKLAPLQPEPELLPLVPSTFWYRPAMRLRLILIVPFMILAALCVLGAVLLPTASQFFYYLAGLLVLMSILYYGLTWLAATEHLTISDIGIISNRYGRERHLPWTEACLFGGYSINATMRPASIEVASRHVIVSIRLSEKKSFTATNMTRDDARAIMQHIAAKTGLSMYEL